MEPSNPGRTGTGCCKTGAPGTIALLAFRISRALERPLILHRLEKPKIKKGICVDIRGEIPRRETACRRSEQVVRSIHPDALLLPTRVLGASTIRFALDEQARTSGRLLATSENITATIMLRGNGASSQIVYSYSF